MTQKNNGNRPVLAAPRKKFEPAQVSYPSLGALSIVSMLALMPALPASAACAPAATSGNDNIACTGSTSQPLAAGDGDDSVALGSSASLNTSSGATTTAIDAGAGNDTVDHAGYVGSNANNVQVSAPLLPVLSGGSNVVTQENHVDAASVGIAGGEGNDELNVENGAAVISAGYATTQNLATSFTITGGDVVTATTDISANASGVAGGAGNDVIANNGGNITATAAAQLTSTNVEHNMADDSHGSADTTVQAHAQGIVGSNDGGDVVNRGGITAAASADSFSFNLEMNAVDKATADAVLTLNAEASGVKTGVNGGSIDNRGGINIIAESDSLDVGINLSYLDITISDRKVSNAGTTVNATGTGIDGSSSVGGIQISQSGSIDASAESNLHSVAISLASEGMPVSAEPIITGHIPGVASIGLQANAHASGITGGSADDQIDNAGDITATAESDAEQDSINIGMSLIDWKIPTPGVVIGGATSGADAQAIGIDGGAGDDAVDNAGHIVAHTESDAFAVTVSANISGFTDNTLGGPSIPGLGSFGASLAVADTHTLASSTSTGILGGEGDDTLRNAGTVDSSAEADGGAVSAAATLNIKYKEGENLFSVNAVAARSVTQADATAYGLDGGAGNDSIVNSSTINASADADATAVAVGIAVAGSVKGNGGAASLAVTDTSSIANAYANSLRGDAGDDAIVNFGILNTGASADVLSVSASVTVGFARQGLVLGASLARSAADANAASVAMEGNDGNDRLTNDNEVRTSADATANAISVAVTASATSDGVNVSAGLADATGNTHARASGMEGGAGNDTLINNDLVTTGSVDADSLAASITVTMSGTNNGIAAGLSIANTSANAVAAAVGLDGGDDDDTIRNDGAVSLQNLDADAQAISVGVTLNAAFNAGIAAGAVSTDASVNAQANATGLDGGAGNDSITNNGSVSAHNVDASARATSVAVAANISMAGAAASAAFADTSSNATTMVKGIDGGAGNDTIVHTGSISLEGDANVDAASIAVTITAALGVGAGMEIADASSHANSTVIGIDGGTGRNQIGVQSSADITSTARADADALAISIGVPLTFGGDVTTAKTRADTVATAVGIQDNSDAGATGSVVTNGGWITTYADASSDGMSISANLRGKSLGDVSTNTIANTTGIQTGAGADTVVNNFNIVSGSLANAVGLSASGTIFGESVADADSTAASSATGINTGAGDDQAANNGSLNIDTVATASARSIALDLGGTASTDLGTEAQATVTAMDGGDGNDQIRNNGIAVISSTALTDASAISISLAGTAHGDVKTTPTANAYGLLGGAGDDAVGQYGDLQIGAWATATTTGSSWVIAGSGGNNAGSEARTNVVAVDGGTGNDTVVNLGSILVHSRAKVDADSVSWTLAGTASDSGQLLATSRVTGLNGGDGNDVIQGERITIDSTAELIAIGGSNAIFGNASANTKVGAQAFGVGFDGGAGDDTIHSRGGIIVETNSSVDSNRISFAFAGSASLTDLLTSRSEATVIQGGEGNDIILNSEYVAARAFSEANSVAGASASLSGGTNVAGSATAIARAVGIDGGNGDNQIENAAVMDVYGIVAPNGDNRSSAGFFFSSGGSEAAISATVGAVGIAAGNGDNSVWNHGDLNVGAVTDSDHATVYSDAQGGDFSIFAGGHAYANARVEMTAELYGIRLGAGDNSVANDATITATLDIDARAFSVANGGDGGGYGTGRAYNRTFATVAGIQAGDGDSGIENNGTVALDVQLFNIAGTDADGRRDKSAEATVQGFNYMTATGLKTGNGNSTVINNGDVTLQIDAGAGAWADSDGGFDNGNGFATVTQSAWVIASGIETGNGNNRIENHGLLSIESNPYAFLGYQRGPWLNIHSVGYGNGDATANILSLARGTMKGIHAGDGDNVVINDGQILLDSFASAEGAWDLDAGAHGSNDTRTNIGAQMIAYGIEVGVGNNQILNSGSITIDPSVSAGYGHSGGVLGPRLGVQSTAYGVGIYAHGGNNLVVNDGSIDVTADGDMTLPDPQIFEAPDAYGIVTGDGADRVINSGAINAAVTFYQNGETSADAVGILTGDGNDIIENRGTIEATLTNIDGIDYTTAISAGAGDDRIVFGNGSITNGMIDFGGGRDTVVLEGTPVINGSFYHGNFANAGTIDLVLNGPGSYSASLPSWVSTTKDGDGTYTLPVMYDQERITVNRGTLATTGGGYIFRDDGIFQATINADGSAGRFAIGGPANLHGTLDVINGGGVYSDGMSFDVVTASGGIAGDSTFDVVNLPESTRLVSFSTEQASDAFRVIADVESFTTVALSPAHAAVARQLDALLPGASGEFRAFIGEVQSLSSDDEFATAFSTLSPVSYGYFNTAALTAMEQYAGLLWGRLSELRDETATASNREPLRVAYSGDNLSQLFDARLVPRTRVSGMWLRGFSQRGEQDLAGTLDDFGYAATGATVGYDRYLSNNVLAGLSVASARNQLDIDPNRGEGTIETDLFSAYAGYLANTWYANGSISFGRNRYDTRRHIIVGPNVVPLTSDYDGRLVSATFGAGSDADVDGWRYGSFATLQYTRLSDDGFTEKGSVAGLNVKAHETSSLVSTVGIRFAGLADADGTANWIPQASLAWLHDYQIDDQVISASYVGAPESSFSIDGDAKRDGALFGLGLSYRTPGGFTSSLSYNREWRDGFVAQGFAGELHWEF